MSLRLERLAPRIVEEDGAFRTRMLGIAAGRSDVIALGRGDPDFHTPAHIVEAGERALRDGWHKYTPAQGLPQLREAVSAEFLRHRGVEVDPGRVLIAPGGKPTMFYAIMMFGGSPISVAVPPTLDARASAIRNGTGSTSSSSAISSVTGARSSTVVTLSRNAEATAVAGELGARGE